MITVACVSIKGGVGKTATAVNLAYLAAQDGLRTLLWDMDVQGSATFYLRIRPREKGDGKRLLKKKQHIGRFIRETDHEHLDLLPADESYRKLDRLLHKSGSERLVAVLRLLAKTYDLVLLDCPPGLGSLIESVLLVCDALILPVIPTALSLNTHAQLEEFRVRKQLTRPVSLPFYSMVDARRGLHRKLIAQPPGSLRGMLASQIPYSAEVERMGVERMPVNLIAPGSRAAVAYRALWDEVRARLI